MDMVFISGASGLWCNILFARYGVPIVSSLSKGRIFGLRYASTWWRDVSLLESKKDDPPKKFEKGLIRKVGSGLHTSFWHDSWIGNIPLKIIFHKLFPISRVQDGVVGKGVGGWRVALLRSLYKGILFYSWGFLLAEFLSILHNVLLSEERDM